MNFLLRILGVSMSNSHSPQEVLIEFLRLLQQTIEGFEEPLVPVLRGSLLLKHWFGDRARSPGDIDLECFQLQVADDPDESERQGYEYGLYGEFASLVDFGKAMCRYAADSSRYRSAQSRGRSPGIEFSRGNDEEDGASLWTYGTPGERYHARWTWRAQRLTGRLQIDIAQPGSYQLDEISVADLRLVAPDGHRFSFPAYTPEMMLAAKLSWLLRSFTRRTLDGSVAAPEWSGEPKDLFDIHLLLTRGKVSAEVFQKSLLAVGTQDDLDWNNLEALFDVRRVQMEEGAFANWEAFRVQHPTLVHTGPVEMLHTIVDHLEPLLGDFCPHGESLFLQTIHDNPIDELSYLIYADWLEERQDPRGTFLRLYSRLYFSRYSIPEEELTSTRQALREMLPTMSIPWLHRVFGTPSVFQEIRQQIERAGM